jgi:hypothetical protein
MTFFEDYKIDGQPILAPDGDVRITLTDLDASDTGRDESGIMHRIVVRQRVCTWELTYSILTAQEYAYMERLFAGKREFAFTSRTPEGQEQTCLAYCTGSSVSLRNARTGCYSGYKLQIVQC